MNKLMLFWVIFVCVFVLPVVSLGQYAAEKNYPLSVAAFSEEGVPLPQVEDNLIKVLNKLGYTVEEDTLIHLEGKLSVINEKHISGINPKVLTTLKLDIFVNDADANHVLESLSFTSKGIGNTIEHAIQRGIGQLRIEAEQLGDALQRCQDDFLRIQQRREHQSKQYFEEAQGLIKERKYRAALRRLKSVYPDSSYFNQAQGLIREIHPKIPKPTIAILGFESNNKDISQRLKNALRTTLNQARDPATNNKIFNVVERNAIDNIIKEQIAGFVNHRTARKFGRMLGADFMLLGSLNVKEQEVEVEAYLVDVETAVDVIAAYSRKPESELRTIAQDISNQIIANIDELDNITVHQVSKIDEIISPKELEKLLSTIHKPRIMIVIPEQHMHKFISKPAAETGIIRKFLTKGFKVVDQTQVKRIRDTEQVKAAARGDAKAAAAIGRQNGAEVIIIGEAFSENVPRGVHGFQICRARVEARAVECDTGTIIAADAMHATGADMAEGQASKKALQRAGDSLANALMGQIVTQWSQRSEGLFEIKLSVRQIEFDQLLQLESALKGQQSITDIYLRGFDDGVAVIEIRSKYAAQTIAESIARSKFENFAVKVEALTANKIEISIHQPEK